MKAKNILFFLVAIPGLFAADVTITDVVTSTIIDVPTPGDTAPPHTNGLPTTCDNSLASKAVKYYKLLL